MLPWIQLFSYKERLEWPGLIFPGIEETKAGHDCVK